jgi:hypothetical protein
MSVTLHKYNPKRKDLWLDLRNELRGKNTPDTWRIGSSEVAKVLGRDEYMSKTEFFYHSVDWINADPLKKLPMYRGEIQEKFIFDAYWKYINPDNPSNEEFLDNVYGEKKVYRNGRLFNYTITNDKHPFSYSNPDFQIFKNQWNPKGFVEAKSPTWRSVEKFESNLPVSYLFQTYHQMIMGEVDYAEIIMLIDSTIPEIFPIEPNKVIYDQINDSIHDFGMLVLQGKDIVYNESIPLMEKEQMLADIAPENTGEDHLTDFYKENHKLKLSKASVEGGEEQLVKVLDYLERKAQAKDFDKETSILEQDIRAWFTGDLGTIDFPPYGSITWNQKFNCPARIYKNYHAL